MKIKLNIKYVYFKRYLETCMSDNFAWYSAAILNLVSTLKLPTLFLFSFEKYIFEHHYKSSESESLGIICSYDCNCMCSFENRAKRAADR